MPGSDPRDMSGHARANTGRVVGGGSFGKERAIELFVSQLNGRTDEHPDT